MKYVIHDGAYNPIKIEERSHKIDNSLPAPVGVRHYSEITIADVPDGKGGTIKEAQLDPAKVAAYDALLAQQNADLAAENEVSKRMRRLQFCQEMKARVAIINNSKAWTIPQFQSYMADPIIQQLSGMLSDGYLDMAKDLIETTDMSAYYTAAEKQSIIDKMDVYLNNE